MSFAAFRRRLTSSTVPGLSVLNWVLLETVDSTNALARRVVAAYAASSAPPPPTVFVAYHQSHGCGRGSHRWASPAGKGVYASLLLPAVPRASLASLPLLAAVGVADAVSSLVTRPVGLRWPNDLLVGGRKIGGVLIEAITSGSAEAVAIIGVGVNHGAEESELPVAGATSIRIEGRELPGLAAVTARLISSLSRELEHVRDEAYAAERYARASIHRPGERLRCRTPAGTIEGVFQGFDCKGFLQLGTRRGERLVSSGELIEGTAWRAVSPSLRGGK